MLAYKVLRKTEDGLFSYNTNIPILYRKHYRRRGVNMPPKPGTKLFVFDTVEHALPHMSAHTELWQVEVPQLQPITQRAEMQGDSQAIDLFWSGLRYKAVRVPAGTCVVDWLKLVKKVR